jgi:hypothetical protein
MHLPAIGQSGKRAIVPTETDPRMEHHRHQEDGLAVRETVQAHLGHALVPGHPRNSSATRGLTEVARPLAPEPPTRADEPRNRVKPARTFPAAWAPR